MDLRQSTFQCGNEVAIFEIGYRTPKNGCHYMLNQETGQLEEIFGEEFRSVGGREVQSVETRSGTYEVDGTLIFARRLLPLYTLSE